MATSTSALTKESVSKGKIPSNSQFYDSRNNANQYEIGDFSLLLEAITDMTICKYCMQYLV